MKPYGIKRKDRITCTVTRKRKNASRKPCSCGDWQSKYPQFISAKTSKSRPMKKTARQHSAKLIREAV